MTFEKKQKFFFVFSFFLTSLLGPRPFCVLYLRLSKLILSSPGQEEEEGNLVIMSRCRRLECAALERKKRRESRE